MASQSAFASTAVYERDLIDRVQAAFGNQMAPSTGDRGIGPAGLRCGTPLLMEIKWAWPNLTEPTRAAIANMVQLSRPTLAEYYDTPDGHFRVHFSRTGTDAINMSYGVGDGNVPVYILNCAHILSQVVQKEIVDLGFRFPVSDSVPRHGEDPRFDIYFQALGSTFYGLTYPDTIINNGLGKAFWASSYMVLHSDYSTLQGYQNHPFDAMAVTVAHEFHHACQWTYDAFEAEERTVGGSEQLFPWWLELSAVAMEDVVFDSINDYYAYLPWFFNYPGVSLRAFAHGTSTDAFHPYGSAVWGLFLAKKYGPTVLREIWEACGQKPGFNTFEAYQQVISSHGSSFRQAWAEFLVWNFYTGSRATDWAYHDGHDYPLIFAPVSQQYATFPVSDTASASGYPLPADEFAAAYMRFVAPHSDTALTFRFELSPYQPSDFSQWMVVTAGVKGQLEPIIQTWDGSAEVVVPQWNSYDELLVIATPFKSNPTQDVLDRNLGFYFNVSDSLAERSSVTEIRKIYSNPLVLGADGSGAPFQVEVARAQSVPVTMRVFTLDGHEVRGGKDDTDDSNQLYKEAGRSNVTMTWNGTTRDGHPVAHGIYLALLQIGDHHELVKVAVESQNK